MTKTDELKLECQKKGLRYVGTRGSVGSPICLIGEAPGADEDQAGVPFVGAAGRELDRLLWDANISHTDCWWTNPYKTRPPDNKMARLAELGIPLKLYEEQFFEELAQFRPTIIVCLGATPLGLLCPFTISPRTGTAQITAYRGSILQSPLLQWPHYVVACFHPAFLFRDWSERPTSVLCLMKAHEELAYWRQHGILQPLPVRKLVAEPPADDAIDYLRQLCELRKDQPIACDIENIGIYRGPDQTAKHKRLPYVIGFSHDPAFAMSIGFTEYDTSKAVQVWRGIDRVLSSKVCVWQNGFSHDIPWLRYVGFSPDIKRCHDTLVRHWVLWPEMPHRLEVLTFQYTREPYYKVEGKAWTPKEGVAKLKRYNCKDACVTLEVWQKQEEEFIARGL